MKNHLPKRFSDNVVERPAYIAPKSTQNELYDDLAETLSVIDTGKAVKLAESEAIALFGKCYHVNICRHMKKRDIPKVKVGNKGDTVFIWSIKV